MRRSRMHAVARRGRKPRSLTPAFRDRHPLSNEPVALPAIRRRVSRRVVLSSMAAAEALTPLKPRSLARPIRGGREIVAMIEAASQGSLPACATATELAMARCGWVRTCRFRYNPSGQTGDSE